MSEPDGDEQRIEEEPTRSQTIEAHELRPDAEGEVAVVATMRTLARWGQEWVTTAWIAEVVVIEIERYWLADGRTVSALARRLTRAGVLGRTDDPSGECRYRYRLAPESEANRECWTRLRATATALGVDLGRST